MLYVKQPLMICDDICQHGYVKSILLGQTLCLQILTIINYFVYFMLKYLVIPKQAILYM